MTLTIPLVWLDEGEDIAAARAIEAGLYAHYLIQRDGASPSLTRVVEAGQQAHALLWSVGLRVARRLASRLAALTGLPEDDVFQDASLAVARAIHAFDHQRETRFTTFVHHVVTRALSDEDHLRVGALIASRSDRRASRKAARAQQDMPRDGLAAAASAAGVSLTAVARARWRQVPLDEATSAVDERALRVDEAACQGVAFLDLLSPMHRRVLQERYLAQSTRTLAEVASTLGVSSSTVLRWERAALSEARLVLSRERTEASVSPIRRPAASCVASQAR